MLIKRQIRVMSLQIYKGTSVSSFLRSLRNVLSGSYIYPAPFFLLHSLGPWFHYFRQQMLTMRSPPVLLVSSRGCTPVLWCKWEWHGARYVKVRIAQQTPPAKWAASVAAGLEGRKTWERIRRASRTRLSNTTHCKWRRSQTLIRTTTHSFL